MSLQTIMIFFVYDMNLTSEKPTVSISEPLKVRQWCIANKLIINFHRAMQAFFTKKKNIRF